ncbi:MAG: hypothetical protein K8R90_09395 [Candidatus Cloacimonetes bacterium]|nr:hypothetical protein [Candidatus Cloacimonadota bacterium]
MRNAAGRHALCRHCEQYPGCNARHLPRMLSPVSLVLGYLFEAGRGGVCWPWPGDHRRQPLWFIDLMQHARQVHTVALRQLTQTTG